MCVAVVAASVCLFFGKNALQLHTKFITLFVSEVVIWDATEISVVISHREIEKIGRKVKINNKRMEFVCYADTANYHLNAVCS